MADTSKHIWNDNDGEPTAAPKPKRNGLRRALLLLSVLLAVFGIVVVAAYRDGTGFDVLRRYLHYGTMETAAGEVRYRYDADSANRFAVLGDKLVVLSGTSLQVLSSDGQEVWQTNVTMAAPALVQGGGMAAAYDVGGTVLYVLDEEGEVKTLTAAEGEPFLAATLNDQGMLAVTTEKQGHKGSVQVYNRQMELVFAFHSSRRFLMDAYVTDDNTCLAAVTMGQEDGVFVSNVVIYDLTKTDPVASYSVPDGLLVSVGGESDAIFTLTDTGLTAADSDGTVLGTYDFDGGYLRDYDLAGDGFAALLVNRYKSGSVGALVTVNSQGEELGRVQIEEEVLDISACGRYLAVLCGDTLTIYNQEMQTYAVLHGTDTAREVLVREDGSALLLSAEKAELFLP